MADCPECGYELVEATDTDVVDSEAVYVFECDDCGHDWTKPIL